MEFESIGLWSRALGELAGPQHAAARERLRAVYRRFWENACHLAAQISRDLPNLTLHDVHHFEALWDRADQIAGPEFVLTPLEVFVFGGAILLHDAANTTAAFDAGLADIQRTPEWRDAVYSLGGDPLKDPAFLRRDVAQDALLMTLRSLHAQRAVSLGSMSVKNTTTGTTHHLIEDDVIRNQLGPLIGQIAASHHWDLDQLERRLPPQIGSLSGFPRDWIIRPILIACLLRASDAVQIDQRRVPDFLMALLKLRGLSEIHWRSQNLLTVPWVDTNDSKSMVFASSRPYREEDADAWWLAYDAIYLAHSELQACSVLLNDLRMPAFAVDRIRNAESPTRLSATVQTAGWAPVSAEVTANRVARIIEMFGGEQLYGQEPQVALRELIQNAVDAVRHRRALEPETASYVGSVTVRLTNQDADGGAWLVVEDDGLGMSEAVLTGPLIDFGESYIASRLAQQERPGLSAASERRIGRFGIGFFSVFILGERVLVSSRPFDRSLADIRTLSFRSGLVLRPLLLDRPVADFGGQTSTRVSVYVSKEIQGSLFSPPWGQQRKNVQVSLDQMVTALCPFSDVDIFLNIADQERKLVRSQTWPPADAHRWLREVTVADTRAEPGLDELLASALKNLRPIDPAEPAAGVAAISFLGAPAGVQTINGLRAGTRWSGYSEAYIGTLDHEPDGPDRSRGPVRLSKSILAEWATEQAGLIAEMDLEPRAKITAAVRVSQFEGDCRPIAGAMLNGVPTLVTTLVDFLAEEKPLVLILQRDYFGVRGDGSKLVFTSLRLDQNNPWMSYFRLGEVDLSVNLLEPVDLAMAREFWLLPEGDNVQEFTFFASLVAECRRRNMSLCANYESEYLIGRYIGPDSARDNLANGSEIRRQVGILTAASRAA